MIKPEIDEPLTREIPSLTPQMSGELLAEIKRLAREHYLELGIGTYVEFEKMWREAFLITDNSTDKNSK